MIEKLPKNMEEYWWRLWEREELVGIGNGEDSYRPLQACHWTSSATVKMHTPPTFML